MRKIIVAAFVAAATLGANPAIAKKAPQLSPLAIQQMQIRDFEVGKNITFPAVVTILQDSGYRIQEADKDTGLITASASTKSKLTWAPFVGFGRSKKSPVVSAFIEDRGRGSRVRINFVMAKTKNGAYGSNWSDEEPILDPAVYQDAFNRLDREIFTRIALEAPKVAPIAPSPASVSQSAPVGAPTTSNGLTPDPANMPSALTADPK